MKIERPLINYSIDIIYQDYFFSLSDTFCVLVQDTLDQFSSMATLLLGQ